MSTAHVSDRTALPTSSSITYKQLREQLEVHLKIAGRQSAVANYNSTLSAFMSVHGRSEKSLVGSDFDGEFELLRDKFLESQRRAGLKSSTRSSRKTHLGAIYNFYKSEVAPGELPPGFSSALVRLLAIRGYRRAYFYQKFLKGKCPYTNFQSWCNGTATPSTKSLPLIRDIENHLEVEEGTLISRLPRKLKGSGRRRTGQTTFAAKVSNAKKKCYGVWTEKLEKEFAALIAFKASAVLPNGQKRNKRGVWTKSISSDGVHFASAEKVKGELQRFFGYCTLPSDPTDPQLCGLGLNHEDLTLALLTDQEIVRGYLDFQKVRAGGKYNNGAISFLSLVTSLLRPETGYVYQHPELSQKSNDSMAVPAWQTLCLSALSRLLEILSLIRLMKKENDEENFELGRNPMEPIENIIGLDRPLYAILRMIESMLLTVLSENAPPVRRAIQFRDILLVALLSANPLRIRQFAIMEFDRHLVRRDDGSWWLQFKKGEFKNRRSLRTDYRVRVEEHIWPLIERYRAEFRPLLAGANRCKYVFRPSAQDRGDSVSPMRVSSLHRIIIDHTYHYIPNCPGFGPHAFRHIVATDIIKANPGYGFFLAAIALHDRLETVKEDYAHLETSELFEPYNVHYAEAWTTIMPEVKGGAWA